MLGRVAAAEVPAHPIRVGTNHEQVIARAEVAVAGAGGSTTTSPAASSKDRPSGPPSITFARPAAIPSTSWAVEWKW